MKKLLFIMMLATAMIGCSKDEPSLPGDSAQTRSIDASSESLSNVNSLAATIIRYGIQFSGVENIKPVTEPSWNWITSWSYIEDLTSNAQRIEFQILTSLSESEIENQINNQISRAGATSWLSLSYIGPLSYPDVGHRVHLYLLANNTNNWRQLTVTAGSRNIIYTQQN